jgi:hypothetical protein
VFEPGFSGVLDRNPPRRFRHPVSELPGDS